MTDNIHYYNDQYNDTIDNYPTPDKSGFNFSRGARYPLPVVTVPLQGGKIHRSTVVSGPTFLWDIRATDIMIKIRHTRHYELKMRSNRVEYSTAAGLYCTTHYFKLPFCML